MNKRDCEKIIITSPKNLLPDKPSDYIKHQAPHDPAMKANKGGYRFPGVDGEGGGGRPTSVHSL